MVRRSWLAGSGRAMAVGKVEASVLRLVVLLRERRRGKRCWKDTHHLGPSVKPGVHVLQDVGGVGKARGYPGRAVGDDVGLGGRQTRWGRLYRSDTLHELTEPDVERLRALGLRTVIDLRTIRPLDWMTILESVKKTNRLVIVEEQWPFSSISSEIAYRIQKEGFDYLDAPIRRITSADAPLHYAPNLVALALPDVARTVKLVKEVMYMNK